MNGLISHSLERRQTQSQASPPLTENTLKLLQPTAEPVTLVSDSYRTQTEPRITTTHGGTGVLGALKALVGSASDHSSRMSNLEMDSTRPIWAQLPRVVTVFISRNWHWMRWGLIVLLALFVVCVLLPAGLALLA